MLKIFLMREKVEIDRTLPKRITERTKFIGVKENSPKLGKGIEFE